MSIKNLDEVGNYIVDWLTDYVTATPLKGFIVGVSGGVDSALTATLCAMTGKKVTLLNMPIRQTTEEYHRAKNQISALEERFEKVSGITIDLTETFNALEQIMPEETQNNGLAMANSRARLRMTSLYAIGQSQGLLVAGTGNKVEDFGVGFYTKYGDGGVDLSPIADLMKSEVFALAQHLGVIDSILNAKPTDGLWDDDRNDEDQIGASYDELEWAMEYTGSIETLSDREKDVIEIYNNYHFQNKHKMEPIPVCSIPNKFRKD